MHWTYRHLLTMVRRFYDTMYMHILKLSDTVLHAALYVSFYSAIHGT